MNTLSLTDPDTRHNLFGVFVYLNAKGEAVSAWCEYRMTEALQWRG